MTEEITRGQKNSQHFKEDERQPTGTQKEENTGGERGEATTKVQKGR
jgi:hypothetical protein